MEFKEALKEILKIKGISVLEDQSTLKLLEDYGAFDEYPVFRSIMENIIATKIGEMLQNTFYYSVEDKGQAWTQMKSKLIERLPYDEVFLNLFLDDMENAFMGYAYERGSYDRDLNSDVEEMLGQVWTDNRGVKYSADKKRLINASEISGIYIVNPETEYIDSYAFQQNSKIERVILPRKLKKIGSHAFQICPYLNTIEFQDGISEIDECAFGGCALTEVYLPNGLHQISDALFSSCTNLLYVHISKNVTSIGAHAFSDCHCLQYMVIPDNVSTIGDLAFRWCKSLYYVVLPSKLTSVGENIFDNCESLKYIGIPKGTKSKFTHLMPQYASLLVEYELAQSNDKMKVIKREILNYYQGKENVIHCAMADGREAWLSQEKLFTEEFNNIGASRLNTVENATRHVLFLFNSNNEEVGRYYLGKKLQGMSPERLVGIKDNLVFFESWNPESASWVPCVGLDEKQPFEYSKEGCGRITVFKEGYYSVIDRHGNIIVPPGKYTYIDGFDHNLARVKIDGMTSINNPNESTVDKWGLIDIDGKEVLPLDYSEIWGFYNKNRTYTRLSMGGVDEYGDYCKIFEEYIFILPSKDFPNGRLKGPGEWFGHHFSTYDEIEQSNADYNYSVWDALEDEPDAVGNIDYD